MGQEKLAAKIFDSVVKRYDRFLRFATFGLIDKWQETLVNNTPAGKYPVDVGTGTGEVVKKITDRYPEALPFGIDVAPNMLKTAKEKNKDSRAVFMQASAYNLPFKNGAVSSILMSLVFRHLDGKTALVEFDRVLQEGGHVGLLDISKPSPALFKAIFFFANRIFRPIGEKVFSKEEYDYFMESILNARTPSELERFFGERGFSMVFSKTFFLGMVVVAVFKKKAKD
ncbi:MAG: class I SAM-dependent methyltransferase [Aquificae bacterium]|nr:class I SAM-dependent methyltransferase [Aquificota bacterium]